MVANGTKTRYMLFCAVRKSFAFAYSSHCLRLHTLHTVCVCILFTLFAFAYSSLDTVCVCILFTLFAFAYPSHCLRVYRLRVKLKFTTKNCINFTDRHLCARRCPNRKGLLVVLRAPFRSHRARSMSSCTYLELYNSDIPLSTLFFSYQRELVRVFRHYR